MRQCFDIFTAHSTETVLQLHVLLTTYVARVDKAGRQFDQLGLAGEIQSGKLNNFVCVLEV